MFVYITSGIMIPHLLITLAATVLALPASAESTACSLKDQYWVSNELPGLKTWAAIHKSFQQHAPQCDDGFIAEGYTEAVVVLLAHRWQSIRELTTITKHDLKFEKFVLRHINASADPDDLKRIQLLASSQCPAKHKALCSSIYAAATEAIKIPYSSVSQ